MLESFQYPDTKYIRELISGLNVAGPVRPSNVWPSEPDPRKSGTPTRSIDQIMSGAWEYRNKIRSMSATECSQTILDDTIQKSSWDCAMGSRKRSRRHPYKMHDRG
jgi:hypothetical protein